MAPSRFDVYGEEGEGSLSEEELFIDKHIPKTGYETSAATSVGKASERGETEERLQRLNEERDRSSDGHAVRMHEIDRRRIMEAICSSLPVSKPERELAVSRFEPLDLTQFGNQKAVEKVALATVRCVVDERRVNHGADWDDLLRDSPEYEAAKESILDEERGFMNLCNEVEEALKEPHLRSTSGFGTTPGPDPNLPNNN